MSQITTEDNLLLKHRKERKDLQAQVQSLKKTCAKGDKKKKKEVAEQIARLELELDEKQTKELDEISTDLMHQLDMSDNLNNEDSPEETKVSEEQKLSKAARRRNKRVEEEKEREERIKEQEEVNKNGPRLIESKEINELLKKLGLRPYSVPADGNCLYCSINHQLKETGRNHATVPELRRLTADWMRAHKADIMPFMSQPDSDDAFTDDQFEVYCCRVAATTEWGGQVEIQALANVLKCPIKVIQAAASPTIQGEEFEGPPLVLTYHRHLFGLGEHYNSTVAFEY